MNTRRCIVAVTIWLPLASFVCQTAASQSDRLLQVDLTEFPRSRGILLSKLGPTPFDCGRVIFKPAFAPEYSVSVHSTRVGDKLPKYVATYIKAEDSLNELFEPGVDPKEAQAVKVRRIDCEISKQTAEKLKQAWMGMLSGNQRARPMTEEDATRATDATIAEFSIQLSQVQILYAELLEVESPRGPKTKMLVDLANTLVDYCKARKGDRGTIASKIDGRATQLLKMLK